MAGAAVGRSARGPGYPGTRPSHVWAGTSFPRVRACELRYYDESITCAIRPVPAGSRPRDKSGPRRVNPQSIRSTGILRTADASYGMVGAGSVRGA